MNTEELNALGYPVLKPKTPVPSDIEVSQSIVRDVGLLPITEVGKQYVIVAKKYVFLSVISQYL
jgi:hypothetical protein